ncbi:MAG TPA: COX15/CtaA family protein [Candidatus Binatia bacterium]|nr:COX15/CtaA family protein [Candidatus Binatia bacterium]
MKAEGGSIRSSLIPHPSSFSVWPHRLAVVLVCATLPLLFIGGLVTSKGAGLAVPDWPTTFGYNMFLYPWSQMVGNVFYEHSHRLVASGVGLLTIALAVTFWLQERRHWLRWLGVAALLLVILQGIIGGLRVVLLENTLAIVHAALAQAFFALTVSLAIFTSTEWNSELKEEPISDGGRLRRLCAITTGLIYLQAIVGAVLRHTGERVDIHLLFAALIVLHVLFILVRIMKLDIARPKLTRLAGFLAILLIIQMLLGLGSYFGKFTSMLELPMEALVILTTTHVAMGALMLAVSLLLTLRAYRFSATSKAPMDHKVLAEQFSG